ncbi:MAG: DNA replication/repair protein RecF [Clostridia bacterium]|nr:DNA replication/repair protein RecF [Clostridia bacterium]
MKFTSLRLQQFRNYPFLELQPGEGVTVLYGPNGSGKTNLLEAMHLLSLGRSHRTAQDQEMIAAGQHVAIVHGQTERLDGGHEVEVRLYPFEKPRKRVLLWGKPAPRIADMMGHATVVMFSPEDIRIVRDGPAARRRFVDMQLSQIRPSYVKALKTYLSALENRNALLKQSKFGAPSDFENELAAWDEQLAAAAAPIVNARRWFLTELSDYASRQYADISENPAEPFAIRYTGPLAQTDTPYRDMLAGLAATRKDDLQRLFTHFGPHRDDVAMTLYGKELRAFGSQGQLRTAVLSLKLGEISLIENEMGELPTLLLDDVFSELDIRRRSALLRATEHLQTFLSCTDKQDAAGAHAEQFLRVSQNANGEAAVSEG